MQCNKCMYCITQCSANGIYGLCAFCCVAVLCSAAFKAFKSAIYVMLMKNRDTVFSILYDLFFRYDVKME